jgi:hypothetical protein
MTPIPRVVSEILVFILPPCGIGGVSVSLAASRIAKKIYCWKRFKNSIIVPPVLQGMPVFPNDMALLKGSNEHRKTADS